jgi:predicted AAA+ superfamily ATPase
MINRPYYINQILPFVNTPFVKILTGVRRCGKSTILQLMVEELKKRDVSADRIIHFNFDSLQNDSIKDYRDLYKTISENLYTDEKIYLFLDEVQEVTEWERAVNSIMIDFNVDIYVTGSNSRMLSSEISTYLTGRYIRINVYPLSFKEYLSFKSTHSETSDLNNELISYLKLGGFPALHLREYSQNEAYTIVRDIYNSTIFKDIVQHSGIRKIELLERTVKFIFDNVGKRFSAKSISDYLKSQHRTLDTETVYQYLSLLENAFIIYRCQRYDLQGKEILKTQEKYYLADSALKYSILGYFPTSVAAMLENIVYLELKRRGFDVYTAKSDTKEIDFIAIQQNNKIYIQVCKEINNESTRIREYENLKSIHDNYPKYILRTDNLGTGNIEGIITMHIADFLMLDEW